MAAIMEQRRTDIIEGFDMRAFNLAWMKENGSVKERLSDTSFRIRQRIKHKRKRAKLKDIDLWLRI